MKMLNLIRALTMLAFVATLFCGKTQAAIDFVIALILLSISQYLIEQGCKKHR